ncbi:MAG: hypothetical protein ABIJ86_12770 [Spirochaetota bacterium]
MIRLKMLGILAPLQMVRDTDGYMEIPGDSLTVGELVKISPAQGTDIKYSILINKRVASMESRLKDGDMVMFMPLLAGG